MVQFQNKEMRFDLDPTTGEVLRVEMQVVLRGNITDNRDQEGHEIDTVKALVIPGEELSTSYKSTLENLASGFLAEYRTFKARP